MTDADLSTALAAALADAARDISAQWDEPHNP